jgi:antitoxin ParD1/3/4
LTRCEAAKFCDVKQVRPLEDYILYVELEDGREGVVDIKPYLNHGVFQELQDKSCGCRIGCSNAAPRAGHRARDSARGREIQRLTILVSLISLFCRNISLEAFMHISLTPELESRIKAKVDSGLYNNASEVIREALRFMDTHEDWIHEIKLAHLREQLKVGIDQLDGAEGIAIESKVALNAFFEEIKR